MLLSFCNNSHGFKALSLPASSGAEPFWFRLAIIASYNYVMTFALFITLFTLVGYVKDEVRQFAVSSW